MSNLIPSSITTLTVKVKPNSSKNKVLSYDNEFNVARITLKAKAEGGKANEALINFLSKELGREVKILKGKSIPTKVVKLI